MLVVQQIPQQQQLLLQQSVVTLVPSSSEERSHVNWRGLKLESSLNEHFQQLFIPNYIITTLNLTDNGINENTISHVANLLSTNQTIEVLNLSSNIIGLNGLARVASSLKKNRFSALRSLYLCDNNFGPECGSPIADIIKEPPVRLTHLNLYNNKLTDLGLKKITDALACNTTLTYIGLSSNLLKDAGAKLIADSMKVNKTIEKLYLHNNYFTDEGARSILGMLSFILGSVDVNRKYNHFRFKVINLNGNRISRQMISCFKNEFSTKIPLLDIDHQKLPEIEPLKTSTPSTGAEPDNNSNNNQTTKMELNGISTEERTIIEDPFSARYRKSNNDDDNNSAVDEQQTRSRQKGPKLRVRKIPNENEDPECGLDPSSHVPSSSSSSSFSFSSSSTVLHGGRTSQNIKKIKSKQQRQSQLQQQEQQQKKSDEDGVTLGVICAQEDTSQPFTPTTAGTGTGVVGSGAGLVTAATDPFDAAIQQYLQKAESTVMALRTDLQLKQAQLKETRSKLHQLKKSSNDNNNNNNNNNDDDDDDDEEDNDNENYNEDDDNDNNSNGKGNCNGNGNGNCNGNGNGNDNDDNGNEGGESLSRHHLCVELCKAKKKLYETERKHLETELQLENACQELYQLRIALEAAKDIMASLKHEIDLFGM